MVHVGRIGSAERSGQAQGMAAAMEGVDQCQLHWSIAAHHQPTHAHQYAFNDNTRALAYAWQVGVQSCGPDTYACHVVLERVPVLCFLPGLQSQVFEALGTG